MIQKQQSFRQEPLEKTHSKRMIYSVLGRLETKM